MRKDAEVKLIFTEEGLTDVTDGVQRLLDLLSIPSGSGGSGRVAANPRGGAFPAPGAGSPSGGYSPPMFPGGGAGTPYNPYGGSPFGGGTGILFVQAQTVHIEAKGEVTISTPTGAGGTGGGNIAGGTPGTGGGQYGNSPGAPIAPPPVQSPGIFGPQEPQADPTTFASLIGRKLGIGANQAHQLFGGLPGMSSLLDMGVAASPFIAAGMAASAAYTFAGQQAAYGYQNAAMQANDLSSTLGGGQGTRALGHRLVQTFRLTSGYSAMQDAVGSIPIIGSMLAMPSRIADQYMEAQIEQAALGDSFRNAPSIWASRFAGGESFGKRLAAAGDKWKTDPLAQAMSFAFGTPAYYRDPQALQNAANMAEIANALGPLGRFAPSDVKDPQTWLAQNGWLAGMAQFSGLPDVMRMLSEDNDPNNMKIKGTMLMPSLALRDPMAMMDMARKGLLSESAARSLAYKATDLNYAGSILGYEGAIAGSAAGYGQAMGYGADKMVPLVGEQISNIDSRMSILEQKANMAGVNTLDKKMYESELASLRTQRAQLSYQQAALPGQQAMGLAGASMSFAGTQTALSSYSFTPAMSNQGFAAQTAAIGEMSAAIDLALANPQLSPVERQSLRAQKAQLDVQRIEIPRQQVMMAYGERTSAAGLASAEVQAGTARAGLFGSAGDIAGARRKQLDVIDQQIGAEEQLLADLRRVGGTVREVNEIETRIRNLKTQRMTEEEQISRDESAGRVQLASTRAAERGIVAGDAFRVFGSAASFGAGSEALGQSRQGLSYIRQEIARESAKANPDSQYLASLRLQERQAQSSIIAGETDLAEFRGDPAFRSFERRNTLYGQVMQRTYAGYGDVRGYAENTMAIAGQKVEGIIAQRDKALSQATSEASRTAIRERAEEQLMGASMEALGAQEQLERGWQERLISSVYGAPGNFNMVASRFTMQEASSFYGVMNRAFGGGYDQMRYHKGKGGLWYDSVIQATGRPEGFAASALNSGNNPIAPISAPSMSGTTAGGEQFQVAGKIEVLVTVQDANGNTMNKSVETVQALRSLANQIDSPFRGMSR